ncbi:MAG: ABC transporter permease [Isosphaeraceae bacterium]
MLRRWNPWPVFGWELRRASRQSSFYVARSVLVGGLLAGLAAVWWGTVWRLDVSQPSGLSQAGRFFFIVMAVVQLCLVALAAPAATAGAFCSELSRGHVDLVLATGMTALDVVVGTLAARFVQVLSGVACVVPLLVLSHRLFGVPIECLFALELVTAGCATAGCTLALAVSTTARRFHEVLVTTYVILAGWLLGYPVIMIISTTPVGRLIPSALPRTLLAINPFRVALEPMTGPLSPSPFGPWALFGTAIGVAIALAGFAAWRLGSMGNATPARRGRTWRLAAYWPGSGLDANPIVWRECRQARTSWWFRLLWASYVTGAVVFTSAAVYECVQNNARKTDWAAPFNGFQVTVGLLLLSLTTPAALAEDRARGTLDVLLSTPLSTRAIVLGKWWAHYRVVPWLALLPTAVASAHAFREQRWGGVLLIGLSVLALGSAATSLGIGLAAWFTRIEQALTLSAAFWIGMTVAWVVLVMLVVGEKTQLAMGLASGSPFFGVGILTGQIAEAPRDKWPFHVFWASIWIVVYFAAAAALLIVTLRSFDRCVGRVPAGRDGCE